MFYIRIERGLPVEICEKGPGCGPHWLKLPLTRDSNGWIHSRDFPSYGSAQAISVYLTAMSGRTYLPTDEGPGCSPRYRIIEAPQVGDEVSKGFNGDYYPVGKITRITPTWQVTTDQGNKFRRYKNTSGWRAEGGTWWMVNGVHDERNPHF
jgi:hypothetical protein